MTVYVGTSGWQYAHWRGLFYDDGLPQRLWLERYVEAFDTVELNNAFYRLPELATFAAWRERTPPGFVMAVKASRYLTHIRRLQEPAEPVGRLMERVAGLGDRLGPVLLQLPPTLRAELGRLEETLASFPPGVRVAVEARHPSWFTPAYESLLAEHGAALCLTDSDGRRSPLVATTDWGYVRFHSGRATPRPCYGREALRSWAGRLAALFGREADVYAYFNNDPQGCAPRDAVVFAGALARAGLACSRVPTLRSAPLARSGAAD